MLSHVFIAVAVGAVIVVGMLPAEFRDQSGASSSSSGNGPPSDFPPTFNGSGNGWRWFCEGNCYEDHVNATTYPGMIFMGGGLDVAHAFQQQIKWSGGGDFVVVRSDIDNGYNDWVYRTLGGVNSATSLIVFSQEAANTDFVVEVIERAEAIFIAGGNQWHYFEYWKGTRLEDALRRKRFHVPIGGTSAGCMVLPQMVFDAEYGGILSSDALQDPTSHIIALEEGYLQFLRGTLTLVDTHFVVRDRFGRLLTFMSRLAQEHVARNLTYPLWGMGIDEHTAFAVDRNGNAQIFGNGTAYVLHVDHAPSTLARGEPLTMAPVLVQKLVAGVDTYDFHTMRGGQAANSYHVGAKKGNLTTANPYGPS